MPDKPWDHVACDLMGPLPNGESVLVLVDYYSRYFEVAFLRSTAAPKVIEVVETAFCRWGIPLSLRTDNGPQFVSGEFQDFLREYGVYWMSTTPMWPAANGEVERQNRSLLKSLKIAHLSGKDHKAELRKFLISYRSTPHSITGVSPAELMLGRKLRTKLPCLERTGKEAKDGEIRDRQAIAQEKSREYNDKQSEKVQIEVGDEVLVRQSKANKLSPTYQTESQQIVSKQGSEVVVKSKEGSEYRRNISDIKPVVRDLQVSQSPAMQEPVVVESRPIRVRAPPERYGPVITH